MPMPRDLHPAAPSAAAILAQRAALLAQPPRPEVDREKGAIRALEFSLGQHDFALGLQWLREVRPVRGLAALPLALPNVLGIANLRGQLLPVIDLAGVMGLGLPGRAAAMMLVIGNDAPEYGVVAHEIGAVETLSMADITRRSERMREFQPGLSQGCTADGRLLLDGGELMKLARSTWGARAPDKNIPGETT